MLFYDEAEKLQAAGEINTCLGNATGQLRGDLLSCCCVCGLLIPTNLIPDVPIVDENHRGDYYKNMFGLWRHKCPRCGDAMLPNQIIPPPWDGMGSVKEWMNRKSDSPQWSPLMQLVYEEAGT